MSDDGRPACPTCGEDFRTTPAGSTPFLLACGHNICQACVDVCTLVEEEAAVCPVCGWPAAPHTPNYALAAYVEGLCSPEAPVAAMLNGHAGCADGLETLAVRVQSKTELLTKTQGELMVLIDENQKRREALTGYWMAACADIDQEADELLACVERHRARRLTHMHCLHKRHTKVMDACLEELTVTASQTNVLAAMGRQALLAAGPVDLCSVLRGMGEVPKTVAAPIADVGATPHDRHSLYELRHLAVRHRVLAVLVVGFLCVIYSLCEHRS